MAKIRKDDEKESIRENGIEGSAPSDTEIHEQSAEEENIINTDVVLNEAELLKVKLEDKEKELSEYIELAQRVKAEFDNYKKRTVREKEQLNVEIKCDVISSILPVIDNLMRAVSSEPSENGGVIEGVRMIIKQFMDILAKQGLEEIEASGQEFDPAYHNAVMHIDDESYGSNYIVEVFQKGYKLKDRVIRHSVVKVAN